MTILRIDNLQRRSLRVLGVHVFRRDDGHDENLQENEPHDCKLSDEGDGNDLGVDLDDSEPGFARECLPCVEP